MPDDDTLIGQNLVDVRNEGRRAAQQGDRLFTVPPALKPREAHVYQLTEHGPLNAIQAGVSWHLARSQSCSCGVERCCEYASMDGNKTLETLRHHGLLRRDRHRIYRRVVEASSQGEEIPF